MHARQPQLCFIGFGEAAMAFAQDLPIAMAAYDRKIDREATREAKHDDFTRLGVAVAITNRAAIDGCPLILSLVTAGNTVAAAEEAASGIANGALYCDMNSVAPNTKRASAEVIEANGGRYTDVAIMAPVHPGRSAVPLLVSGPHAGDAAEALRVSGFADVRIAGNRVGDASGIKMIRSVMIKGLEALTAECVLAAEMAGVRDEVIASLDASWPGADWAAKANYNLERMMVHGVRRGEEMDEVMKTLDALGTGSAMARATAERQRAIGALGIAPPRQLDHKLAVVLGRCRDEAA